MRSFVVSFVLESTVNQRVRKRPVVRTPRHSEGFELSAVAMASNVVTHGLVRRTVSPEGAVSVSFAPCFEFIARPARSAERIDHEHAKNQVDLLLRISVEKSCD